VVDRQNNENCFNSRLCQNACPIADHRRRAFSAEFTENKPCLRGTEETAEFTQQETELVLKGTPCIQMPKETFEKMKRLSITDYCKELPRNLTILLKINDSR
jgi:hypothetical protein